MSLTSLDLSSISSMLVAFPLLLLLCSLFVGILLLLLNFHQTLCMYLVPFVTHFRPAALSQGGEYG